MYDFMQLRHQVGFWYNPIKRL